MAPRIRKVNKTGIALRKYTDEDLDVLSRMLYEASPNSQVLNSASFIVSLFKRYRDDPKNVSFIADPELVDVDKEYTPMELAIQEPFEDVPLLFGSKDGLPKLIAKWRLQIGK